MCQGETSGLGVIRLRYLEFIYGHMNSAELTEHLRSNNIVPASPVGFDSISISTGKIDLHGKKRFVSTT